MAESEKPASEVPVQKQVSVTIGFENINEFNDLTNELNNLITELNEKINQLQNFKLKVKTIE
jgi:hypothetical protein